MKVMDVSPEPERELLPGRTLTGKSSRSVSKSVQGRGEFCWSDCPRLLIISGFIAYSCEAALTAAIQEGFRNNRTPFGIRHANFFWPTGFTDAPKWRCKTHQQ